MEITPPTGEPRRALLIPCCLCGTLIYPNAANQCGSCLAQEVDLKSILQRGPCGGELLIHQCRRCRRYRHSSTFYSHHDPESNQLLSLCLKQIPALSHNSNHHKNKVPLYNNIKIIDSMWIWTEPHSMRLKLRLTVRAEVSDSPRSVTIQQRVPVEFRVKFEQCPACKRSFTNRTWNAIVQIRQKSSSSRSGLLQLERVLAQNPTMNHNVLRVQTVRNGFDFYFTEHVHAQSFTTGVGKIVPVRTRQTSKLVSEDVKNNEAHVKHTIVCDLVPLSRWDLIVCNRDAGGSGVGRLRGKLCLVERVTNGVIRFIDASPSRMSNIIECSADIHPEKYWKGEKDYRVVFESHMLTRFVVLDVELCADDHNRLSHTADHDDGKDDDLKTFGNERKMYTGPQSAVENYAIADVEVARESDLGVSDETFHCVTHLGNLLQTGDIVLGYDLLTSIITGVDETDWSTKKTFNTNYEKPDIVLVRKAKTSTGNYQEDTKSATESGGGRKKESHKASDSKRREKRRLRKQGKKVKESKETADRVGFDGDSVMKEGEIGGVSEEKDKETLGEILLDDPFLAEEIEYAEKALGDIAIDLDSKSLQIGVDKHDK